jgi:tetratricopeptide (TPR) repeat protein
LGNHLEEDRLMKRIASLAAALSQATGAGRKVRASVLIPTLSFLLLMPFAEGLSLPPVGAQGTQEPTAADLNKAGAEYEKGMQLLRQQRYGEALALFRLVEQQAPQSPQGLTGEGIALALMGKGEDAITALQKALALDPTFWVAQRELGIVYWSQGRKGEAAEELRPLVKLHPDDGVGNAILGQYEFEETHYDQALQYLSRIPGQVAADPALSLIAAGAQLKSGQAIAAAQTLKSLLDRPGLTNSQLFQLAWLLNQAELYKESIQTLSKVPPDFPDALRHYYELAFAYYGDAQNDKCITTLNKLLKNGSTSPEVYALLGAAMEKDGRTKEAYDTFRQGILQNPRDPQNYLNIATLACQHTNYDLAAQILTSGISFIPDSHELVFSRGIAYTLKGDYTSAQRDYDRAIHMAPRDEGNYIAMGLSKLISGDLESAVQAMQKAAELEPKDPRPYYFETEALLQRGLTSGTPEFEQAQGAIDQALALDSSLAGAYADRARLELLAGDTRGAVSDLERAHKADPTATTITYRLAQAYHQTGRTAEASALFAQVKEGSEQEAKDLARRSLSQALVVISQPGGGPSK